jgi:O-antigen ligase
MERLRQILLWLVIAAIAAQLRRVPRIWSAVFMFVILYPKIALAAVPGNTTPLRVDDLVVGVVLAGWIVYEALVPREDPPPPSPLTPFLVLYLAVAGIGTLIGIGALRVSAATGALHFLRFIEYTLLYYFFYRTIRLDDIPAAKEVFRNTWLIVAGIWVAQQWTAATVPSYPIDYSLAFPSFSATYDFGGYAMIATAFCYGLWTNRTARDVWTTLGLLAGLYIVVNGDSRAALVGLAVAILFDLFMRLRVRVAIGLVAIGAAVPYVVSSEKMTRLFEVVRELASTQDIETVNRAFFNDPSINIRLQNWQMALEHWRERPLFGDGLGAFLGYVKIYDITGTPDGWYIRTLAETGLLGLLTFMLIVGYLLWSLMRGYQQLTQPLHRAIVYAAALALLAATTNALLIDTFVSYKIMGAFWMVMAVGTRVATARPQTAQAAASVGGFDPSPLGPPLLEGAE